MREEYIYLDSIRLSVQYVGSYGLHDENGGIGEQLMAQILGLDE